MATKFVAPVTALALLVIASSVGKLSGEKSLLSQRKNPRQLMFAEDDSQPWTIKWLGKWSMCTQFYAVFCQVHVLSHAQCQTLKSRK